MMRKCQYCLDAPYGLAHICMVRVKELTKTEISPGKTSLTLPCIYCGDPVLLSNPSSACNKYDCQDKESAFYEMDG